MAKRLNRDGRKTGRPDEAVTVYVTAANVRCRLLLEYLATKGIRFETRDIVEDRGAMVELAELTGGRLTVPVVLLGKAMLVDPDWKRLKRAIRNNKKN